MRAIALLAIVGLASCGEPRSATARCAARPTDFQPASAPLAPWSAIAIEMLVNRIEIDRGGHLRWNGASLRSRGDPSGRATLDTYLRQSAMLNPVPAATVIFSRGAPCVAVESVRTAMRRHLACRSSGKCLQGDPSS